MFYLRFFLSYLIIIFLSLESALSKSKDRKYPSKEDIVKKYSEVKGENFSTDLKGVKNHFKSKNEIVLTFDGCRGRHAEEYNPELLKVINENQIKVTLFLTSSWITANPDHIVELSKNSLIEIENHGTEHKPLSSVPRIMYKIHSTNDVGGIYDEVMINDTLIKEYKGESPQFFRAATAYYDEVAIDILNELNKTPIGFSFTSGDAYQNTEKVLNNLLKKTKPGSIILLHMRSGIDTVYVVKEYIKEMKKRNYQFVHLKDVKLID